jgi:methionyl-tRNA synthetase
MALGIELPKQIFGHPWVLVNKSKMSKSIGNTLYTDDLVRYFGVDTVRYYVLHEIPFSQDGNITFELLIERNNSDLANTIGNLVNRTIGMAHKYREGIIKKVILDEPFELSLSEKSLEVLPKMVSFMDELKVADALEEVVKLARFANKYIDVSEPWALFKNQEKQDVLDHVLYHLLETIRYVAVLLQPFTPETSKRIASQIGITDLSFESLQKFGQYEAQTLGKAEVLFERFDQVKKLEEILKDRDE